MKFELPEISWHGTQPLYSCDFQKASDDDTLRLATSGADNDVKIWKVWVYDGKLKLEVLSILSEHKRSVNCVKFSPVSIPSLGCGLASCDDDGLVYIWLKTSEKDNFANSFLDDNAELNKEFWKIHKTLRGHIEEVQDLCWNSDGTLLLTGSLDTSARLWSVTSGQCLHAFRESKGLIQGVTIDPLGKFIATYADDKSVRVYHASNKRCAFRNTKVVTAERSWKMFGDPGECFFHRVTFSPDGEFLFVPSASYMVDNDTPSYCTYVFCREALNKPVMYLPCGQRPSIAVSFCPMKFRYRDPTKAKLFNLPYRLIFAIVTESVVTFYDTETMEQFARLESVHYATLNSGSWNVDGSIFMAVSSDGYATLALFEAGELGEVIPESECIVSKAIASTTAVEAEKTDVKSSAEKENEATVPEAKLAKKAPNGLADQNTGVSQEKTSVPETDESSSTESDDEVLAVVKSVTYVKEKPSVNDSPKLNLNQAPNKRINSPAVNKKGKEVERKASLKRPRPDSKKSSNAKGSNNPPKSPKVSTASKVLNGSTKLSQASDIVIDLPESDDDRDEIMEVDAKPESPDSDQENTAVSIAPNPVSPCSDSQQKRRISFVTLPANGLKSVEEIADETEKKAHCEPDKNSENSVNGQEKISDNDNNNAKNCSIDGQAPSKRKVQFVTLA